MIPEGGSDARSSDAGSSDDKTVPTTAAQIIDLERSQIGHDLHDTLLPLIFSASAHLQPLLSPKPSASPSLEQASPGTSATGSEQADDVSPSQTARLEQVDQLLRQALRVGRHLLTEIYPPELDSLPWLVAAKDSAERIGGENCEIIWTIQDDSPVNDPGWNRDVAATAYRILIEALRNATKHGQAEVIAVRCSADSIEIADDGGGFEPAAVAADRFGIRSMKGRAKLVGKSLTIESQPGGPTKVRLNLRD